MCTCCMKTSTKTQAWASSGCLVKIIWKSEKLQEYEKGHKYEWGHRYEKRLSTSISKDSMPGPHWLKKGCCTLHLKSMHLKPLITSPAARWHHCCCAQCWPAVCLLACNTWYTRRQCLLELGGPRWAIPSRHQVHSHAPHQALQGHGAAVRWAPAELSFLCFPQVWCPEHAHARAFMHQRMPWERRACMHCAYAPACACSLIHMRQRYGKRKRTSPLGIPDLDLQSIWHVHRFVIDWSMGNDHLCTHRPYK